MWAFALSAFMAIGLFSYTPATAQIINPIGGCSNPYINSNCCASCGGNWMSNSCYSACPRGQNTSECCCKYYGQMVNADNKKPPPRPPQPGTLQIVVIGGQPHLKTTTGYRTATGYPTVTTENSTTLSSDTGNRGRVTSATPQESTSTGDHCAAYKAAQCCSNNSSLTCIRIGSSVSSDCCGSSETVTTTPHR